jgi:hypothetical protein
MTTESTRIAIIGAGNVGGNLGRRLGRSGFPVQFGVRSGADVSALLADCGEGASSASPEAAAKIADVIFLAVPGGVAVDAAKSLGDITGKVLVDCNNPLRWDAGPVWTPPPEGSLSAAIAAAVPSARVVKAFNTFGAEFHADPRIGDTSVDVYIAGDDADAKQLVSKVASRAGFTPIDSGPLRNAAVLENVAMLWIHLALAAGHGRGIAFKLLRREG